MKPLFQNLDVNLAVNNLLSRDDEGEGDDDDSQDSYVPDDLISLLDSGIHPDHPSVIIDSDAMFSEDMFGYSSIRSRGSGTRSRLGKILFLVKSQYFMNSVVIKFSSGSLLFRKSVYYCFENSPYG